MLNTNTLSPLLKRMEKMELLKRNCSSQDERSVIIQVPEKGKQLKTGARPIPEKLLKTLTYPRCYNLRRCPMNEDWK